MSPLRLRQRQNPDVLYYPQLHMRRYLETVASLELQMEQCFVEGCVENRGAVG